MKKIVVGIACAALATPSLALVSAPVAGAYRNCDEARAVGAAPILAGQPGYSAKLDRDGDGVACETGGAPVYAPAPVVAAGYNVVVDWTGTDCIDITVPTPDTRAYQVVNRCGGRATFGQPVIDANSYIGADPAIGDAATLSCEILSGRLVDSGVAGDGHDVTCLTTAGLLP